MTTRSITLAAQRFSRQNKRQSQNQSRQWTLQLRELSQSFSSTSSSSFSSMFSALEFPKATEAPIVTRTTAAHARLVTVTSPKDEHDVFDDAGTLSELERSSIQGAQRRMISTTLRNCKPVLSTPPDDIPPPTISCHQDIPTTMVSTLPNGIKVISQETYGHVCTVGILANAGSTMEKVVGTSHLLELTAFQSTSQYHNPIDIQETLQLWGATPFCHIGREQSLWCLDLLRPNVQKGFALLTDCVLNARYTEEEVIASQQIIGFQWTDKKAETMMTDALQRAAFGPDQPLGRHHFCKYLIVVITIKINGVVIQ
jgi:Insulinase (Peptidase family M16)